MNKDEIKKLRGSGNCGFCGRLAGAGSHCSKEPGKNHSPLRSEVYGRKCQNSFARKEGASSQKRSRLSNSRYAQVLKNGFVGKGDIIKVLKGDYWRAFL